ncbi:MAG: hypothetical protein ABSG82_06380 [Sedimentisphaerales bacterium]|jgi:prepilin-type processing-associated H-X9-DG protein
MRKRAGLTRIDLAVAVACAVFALATVQVYSSSGRGRAKLEVCMANLKTLTAAWAMYADDQNERIPCADITYSHGVACSEARCASFGMAWYEWPHTWKPNCTINTPPNNPSPDYWISPDPRYANANIDDWKHCISDGTLWKYIQDYKIYKCPISPKGVYVSYAISHSMNAYYDDQGNPFGTVCKCGLSQEVRFSTQIKRPAERFVFVDQQYQSNGAFAVQYDKEEFWDTPPMFHGFGMPSSFADGHAEYHQWADQRTKDVTWATRGDPALCHCNQDLYWLQKVIWGKLGYVPSCPPED